MLFEDNSTASLLGYHELMFTLQGLCKEKQSGVMIIHSESGCIAQLILEQGVIFDVNFAGVSGTSALSKIKEIVQGKMAFFKRAKGSAIPHIDLSTPEILQTLIGSNTEAEENTTLIVSEANADDNLPVIEAHLAAIIGPVASIVYREYKEEVEQANDLNKLSIAIEKISQQALSAEKKTLFKQGMRELITRCGSKDQKFIVNLLKSTSKELKLHPLTLSLCIKKYAVHGELSTVLLTKLTTQIEQMGNLVSFIGLFELIKFLSKTSKTGILSIESAEKKTNLYFDHGVLINAIDSDKHGVSVALEVLRRKPDSIRFVILNQVGVTKEIYQSIEMILNASKRSHNISREDALKYTTVPQPDEMKATLSKEIKPLASEISPDTSSLEKAIQAAESYDNDSAEQLIGAFLLAHDDVFFAWFWLARVLTNMNTVEYALKKAAVLNPKSAELAEEVKKFTFARKFVKSDFVLRCPFCWMPVNKSDEECPQCLGGFFIHRTFFSHVGQAKIEILDKAITRYNRVLQTNTSPPYVLFYLAMAYLNRQYYQEALAQFNDCVILMPENKALLKQQALLTKHMRSAGLLASAIKPSSQDVSAKKAKILVVEDSAVTRKVIVRALTENGYDVFEAKNAEEALTGIGVLNPDLVLLDIILPGGKDGYGILSEIRQTSGISKVPVIMLTSRDGLFDKIKGKVSDANEYLTKPFQPDELLLVVRKYLK